MKLPISLLPVSLSLMLALSPLPLGAAATDAEVAARKTALDVAGGFGELGFKLRDGAWSGQFEKGKGQLIEVNLYAGNEYYFSLGAALPAKRVSVTVFDETGRPVEMAKSEEPLATADGAAADAAGFAPEASGPYFIKVEELEGEPATFCLLYSYK